MKIILTAVVAIAVGLAAGYFIFGNKQQPAPAGTHDHDGEAVQTESEEQIWTCSMHPQIRQNEPGLCPICEMDLIPLESNTSNDPLVLQMTEESVKLAQVATTVIGGASGVADRSMPLTGKVQEDERLAASQVAHVPGRIEKLFVTFTGEQVRKGQKLATLYAPELITAQRELLEALRLRDVNPGLAEAARKKLRYWKVGDAFIREVEETGKIQETFTLDADESGIVTRRRVAVGDYVKQGEPLFDLVGLQRVWVLFDAYEEALSSVSVGDRIEFTTPSLPGQTFQTRITFIDPVIDPQTRVASLRTEVGNPNGLLKPEMLVSGKYRKQLRAGGKLAVPKSAVLWTGKRSVVYVKMPDATVPSFQYREVELGEGLGDSYLVIRGLSAGEEVVTNGNFAIDAAAQLNNQMSMMNRDVMLKGSGLSGQLPDYTGETPDKFKHQLARVSDAYLRLKDALVATDSEQSQKAAQQVLEALSGVDMSLLEGEAHVYWMSQQQAIQAHAEKVTKLSDVEEQRKQFGFLSDALIRAIKVFGIPGNTYYVQHCPMAFDDDGADWISDVGEIRNPYFGDKMLKCGVVKDTIFGLSPTKGGMKDSHAH